MSHIDPGEQARVARSREREALRNHPYGREADDVVNTYLRGGTSEVRRKLAVANWLREYVAAREAGCTGLTLPLDGPTIDALGSGEEDRPEDYWRDGREPKFAITDEERAQAAREALSRKHLP